MDVKKGKTGVIIGIIILLNATVMLVNALECYSCYGTGGDNECEKYETYVEAVEETEKGPRLLKNCTAPYNVVCMVERYEFLGATVSHIRDCSDGINFSFGARNKSNPVVYDRLFDLDQETNNETACVWNGQHQVCLSICNSTNYCNGPKKSDIIGGADTHAVSFTILSVNIIVFILREMF